MWGADIAVQRLAGSVGNCYNILKTRQRSVVMCDVKKDEQLYQEIEKLKPEDTLQLVLEAEPEEQKEFYEMVGEFLLQKKEREILKGNCYNTSKRDCIVRRNSVSE